MKYADKYKNEYVPNVHNKSDPAEWKKAFISKYAEKYSGSTDPADQKAARDKYTKEDAGQFREYIKQSDVQHDAAKTEKQEAQTHTRAAPAAKSQTSASADAN